MSDPYQAKTVDRLYNATQALYAAAIIDSVYNGPAYVAIAAGIDSLTATDRKRAQPGIIVEQDKRIAAMFEAKRKQHEKGLTVAKLKYCWQAMKGVWEPRRVGEK